MAIKKRPISPRQKMINLMYVVLMAMLALNVSNEVLNGFSIVEESLNRTLTGICKIYEMQLKGASQQIGTIDEINEHTRKMAEQIAELNRIYARMIEAMTTNMPKVVNEEVKSS